jgi:hypothetical protein
MALSDPFSMDHICHTALKFTLQNKQDKLYDVFKSCYLGTPRAKLIYLEFKDRNYWRDGVVLVFWKVCFGCSDGWLHGFSEASMVNTRWAAPGSSLFNANCGTLVTGLLKSFEIVSN